MTCEGVEQDWVELFLHKFNLKFRDDDITPRIKGMIRNSICKCIGYGVRTVRNRLAPRLNSTDTSTTKKRGEATKFNENTMIKPIPEVTDVDQTSTPLSASISPISTAFTDKTAAIQMRKVISKLYKNRKMSLATYKSHAAYMKAYVRTQVISSTFPSSSNKTLAKSPIRRSPRTQVHTTPEMGHKKNPAPTVSPGGTITRKGTNNRLSLSLTKKKNLKRSSNTSSATKPVPVPLSSTSTTPRQLAASYSSEPTANLYSFGPNSDNTWTRYVLFYYLCIIQEGP